MNSAIEYLKNHILGGVMVFLFTVIAAGVWSLVILVWNLPDQVQANIAEQQRLATELSEYKAEQQRKLGELEDADKSLNRRITNNQTEIFYLLMGKQKPK